MSIKEYTVRQILISKPLYGLAKPSQSNGNVKYLTQSDLDKNIYEIDKYVNCEDSKFFLKKGDLLISRAGSAGKIYYHKTNEQLAFAGYLVKYELDNSIILNKWFYYWFLSNKGKVQIKKHSSPGSTMPKLNPPDVLKFEISIPDLKEQQSIIDIIEPFEKRLEHLNKIKQNLLINIKSIYIINKSDEKISFFEINNVYSSKYNGQKKYIDTSNIGNSVILGFEDIVELKSRANLSPKINSIIIAKMINSEKIYPIIEESLIKECVFSTGFMNIVPKFLTYTYSYMINDEFINIKNSSCTGSVMRGLTNESIKDWKINKPKHDYADDDTLLKYLVSLNKQIIQLNKTISLLIEKYV